MESWLQAAGFNFDQVFAPMPVRLKFQELLLSPGIYTKMTEETDKLSLEKDLGRGGTFLDSVESLKRRTACAPPLCNMRLFLRFEDFFQKTEVQWKHKPHRTPGISLPGLIHS